MGSGQPFIGSQGLFLSIQVRNKHRQPSGKSRLRGKDGIMLNLDEHIIEIKILPEVKRRQISAQPWKDVYLKDLQKAPQGKSDMLNFKNISVFLIFTVLTASIGFSTYAQTCKPGKQLLVFKTEQQFRTYADSAFTDEIFKQLRKELEEIGYCLVRDTTSQIADTSENVSHLLFSFKNLPADLDSSATSPELVVALLENQKTSRTEIQKALDAPLVSFMFDPEDLFSLKAILVKKIAENLRNQYVCHIRIHSSPDKVHISSTTGLDAVTPVEWIQPLGNISVHASREGYEPVQKKIKLTEPGVHTFYLQLGKRKFYHSNFFYPAVTAGLASVVFYSLEHYYYDRYHSLSRKDYSDNPEQFGRTFRKAKTFEYLTLGSILLSGVSLGLSFKY